MPQLRVALALLALGACESTPHVCATCGGAPSSVEERRFSGWGATALDVLLVVDTSPGAAALRQQVVDELPSALQGTVGAGGPPSLHLAAIETRNAPCETSPSPPAARCGLDPAYTFVATGPCGAYTDYGSHQRPEEIAACLAAVPASTCAGGDPLETLALALEDPAGAGLAGWVPFFRPEAQLVVVIVSSTQEVQAPSARSRPVSAVATALLNTAARADYDRTPVVLVLEPATTDPAAAAATPTGGRLAELAGLLGPASILISAAPGQVRSFLSRFLAIFDAGSRCIGPVKDTDATTDGLQPNCAVQTRRRTDDGVRSEALPACDRAQPPCWRLVPASWCAGDQGRTTQVEIVEPPGFCFQNLLETDITCEV